MRFRDPTVIYRIHNLQQLFDLFVGKHFAFHLAAFIPTKMTWIHENDSPFHTQI